MSDRVRGNDAMRRRGAAVALVAVIGLASACGGGSSGADSATGDGGDLSVGAPDRALGGTTGGGGGEAAFDSAQAAGVDEAAPGSAREESGVEPKLISNGAVQLKSPDVAEAVFDVRDVVDTYSGEVTANSTQTDNEGEALRSRLTLRVPTSEFDNAMQDLEKVATLISSSGNTEDVTTTVVDNEVRIKIQRQSIARISVLLDRATSIRDIVAIEAQLSQREADLEALLTQQRYLADQTEMATIKVSVERSENGSEPTDPRADDDGFFAGLAAGWDALKTFGTGTAQVAGALLPWAVTAAVLGALGMPLWRRLRRRTAVADSAPEPSPAG